MYAAPPVAVRCTAAWGWRALQAVLPALAAAVFVGWSLGVWLPEVPSLLAATAVSSAALGAAALGWRRSAAAPQRLEWDGQCWSLDGRPGELRLMIDMGAAVLLRHAREHWLVATRWQSEAAWHAVRVALHARSGGASGDGRGGADG